MKKSFLSLAILLFIVITVFSEGMIEKQGDVKFRDFSWGTSIEEFIKIEGQPDETISENGNRILTYQNIKIARYDAVMDVYFGSSGLEMGVYNILFDKKEKAAICYNDLEEKLSDTYGLTMFSEDDGVVWNFTTGLIVLIFDEKDNSVIVMYMSPLMKKEFFESAGF